MIPNAARIDTMPPSHLVDSFKLQYTGYEYFQAESKGYQFKGYKPQGVAYVNINKELYDKQRNAWKLNEPNKYPIYMDHDVRFTLSCRAGVENDRFLKIAKWQDSYSHAVDKVINMREDETAYDCALLWVDEYNKSFSYGDHTLSFVRQHPTSHPTRGATWKQLLDWGMLGTLSNFTRTITSEWNENFQEKGDWSLSWREINIGNRGRSPDVDFLSYIKWEILRTRQIGYMTGPSSLNAFVPHNVKVDVIRRIFDIYEQLLDTKIYCPKTEGGWIYWKLRESYLSGKTLVHYDVAGMEIITPSIIQGRKRNFDYGIGMVIGYMGSIPELLSGVSPTSDWDMIAHLELLRTVLKGKRKPLYIVILGDDCTLVYDGEAPDLSTPLYENQKKDDIMVRTLGLTTNEFMHPVGNNITIDRADKRLDMRFRWNEWINNQMNIIERAAIVELFTGFINEVPLYEIIKDTEFGPDQYSPKEMLMAKLKKEW